MYIYSVGLREVTLSMSTAKIIRLFFFEKITVIFNEYYIHLP